jgi:hypothetical protein
MTMPFSPNTTYVPGRTPTVKAQDLNDLQTYLSAIYSATLSLNKMRFDGVGNNPITPAALLELLGTTNNATVTPLFAALNGSGKIRTLIDRNGFLQGFGVYQFFEPWLIAPGAATAIWSQSLSAGAAQSAQNPNANYNTRYIQITPSSGALASSISVLSTPLLFMPNNASLSVALEFEIGFNAAALGTTSNVSFVAGFDNGNDPVNADTQFAYLKKQNNNANWIISTNDGGVQLSNIESTPPTTNPNNIPIDRVKMEIQGSSSPFGSYQMSTWVNEVLLETRTTRLPTAAQRVIFGSGNEGGAPSGSPLAYLGPVRCSYNYMLTPPAI